MLPRKHSSNQTASSSLRIVEPPARSAEWIEVIAAPETGAIGMAPRVAYADYDRVMASVRRMAAIHHETFRKLAE